MAGLITHMVIASEILKRLPENTVHDEGLLYLGSLAPDAIHAREGYVREYKKHTHLRDDIYDWDLAKESYHELFLQRVKSFILQNKDRKDGKLDLYRGYVIHLLVDELFVLTIRNEFCMNMEKLGIAQTDKEFMINIITDMNRNDFLLVDRYDKCNEIRNKIEQVPICEVEGYLSEKEMEISRDWMIKQHFINRHQFIEPVYISYDRMMEFINSATENILDRLSENGSLPRMF